MVEARATKPTREPLSREAVLRAALALADEAGIEALTMRRLAQSLGVEAMTLYYHVGSKDEMLDGIVDAVLREVELPAADAPWKPALRRMALSAHDALMAHPWAASLMLAPTRELPARLRYMEGILGCLRRAGFTPAQADHAYHALDSHIAGFTLWEGHFQLDEATLPDLARRFLEEVSVDEYPYLVEHVHEHLRERDPDDEGSFAFGLDLLLDGLERMLVA